MQTFLPYPDFKKTAQCLDTKRLNNQINEALVIWKTLTGRYPAGGGWPNHPATKMWKNYEDCLAIYREAMVDEWEKRTGKIRGGFGRIKIVDPDTVLASESPPWLGDGKFHRAHRSQLLLKTPEWYGQFGWEEKPGEFPYVWPV